MKKIELKNRKYWEVSASYGDLLIIAGVLSASGTDWDGVERTLSGGERVCPAIRVYSGKRRAKKLQALLSGMSEVGCFKGAISYEVYPHR